MFCIASRKRRGIDASASATWRSNAARSTGRPRAFRCPLACDDGLVVHAIVAYRALIAERLRPAYSTAVEDERVGRLRPARPGHRFTQLLLDDFRVVGLGAADAIR